MKFNIDEKIFQQFQDYKLGVIVLKGFDNSRRVSSVESLLRGVCAQKAKQFAEKDIDQEKKIQVWNEAYGKLGVNPKKKSPSVRALLKRVQSGKEIPHINALVDIYNYFSLKYLLPIGSEDLDWLCGDLQLRFTEGDEPFRAIGSIEVEEAAEGEAAYIDQGGITCRHWNYRECERTKLTTKTVNAAIFVEDLSKIHFDEFGEILNEIAHSFIKYVGGTAEIQILNEDKREIDFGIQGRKNIDDSKVTAQEKAFFQSKINQDSQPRPKKKIEPSPKLIPVENKEKPQELRDSETYIEKIRLLVEQALIKSFPRPINIDVKIEYPNSPDHGDYATNIALQLSKELGENPRKIAQTLVDNIQKEDFIENIELAGPGFINFFLSKNALKEELEKALIQKEEYGSSKIGQEKTVIVEYSSINIAKPLAAHHLITTILGQSIYNIYKKVGFKAVSVNYIGDWGTQFGKLIYAFKNWGDRKQVEKDPIPELLKLYVKFHDEAEKNPTIEDDARKEFKVFEDGDQTNRELWKWIVDLSLNDVQKTYDRLGGITFDQVKGESFVEDKLNEMLSDGKQRNIFVQGEEGSFVVQYDDENIPPFLVQKKDGATLYSTRDFATLKYRIEEYRPLKVLYVVDIAQTLHFKQLFQAAQRFPWYHGEGEHVWFGRMRMKDKNMSTRKGNVILLDEVLSEAESRALKIVEEKNPELENKENVAKAIGIGAIKYNILSQNRTTDITFDWDRMLSLDGNSAPYLQYSYARAKSILRKKGEPQDGTMNDPEDIDQKISNLLRNFPKYQEQLLFAAQEYKPNILSNYIFNLAQEFNSFYNSVPVLKADSEEKKSQRIKIVEATSQILKNGLGLLGVTVVEEM